MTNLSYTRRGDGYPVVFQHGYLGGAELWRAQIDHFSARYDVIAPNLAGFGDSAHLQAPQSIQACAKQIFDLLDSLGIEEFNLVGHSMGGMIVQEMAVAAPRRVSRLVCYGTGPIGVLPDRFETIAESRTRLQADGLGCAARRIAATWFVNGENAKGFEVCLAEAEKATLQAALASLSAWEAWDGTPGLGRIDCPTLVLWGDRDRSYGWQQPEALWRGIRNSALAVMPGCAHNAHMEKPALFNHIVDDFFATG